MSQAFRKWKSIGGDIKSELKSVKKEDLEYICVKNDDKINYLARNFQECGDIIEDLTDQRNLLLVRYVGS